MLENSRRSIGVGLICGAVLVFQILSARLLSVVLAEYLIMFAISFAMFGMAAATSLMSLVGQRHSDSSATQLCWMGTALGLSYVVVLFLVADLNDSFNTDLDAATKDGGLELLIATIRAATFANLAVIGAVMFVPYFLFGIFIARLFGSAPPDEYHKLYAADLIGAAGGAILAVLVLDHFGYAGTVAVILILTFAGAGAFGIGRSRVGVAVNGFAVIAVLVALVTPGAMVRLEPTPFEMKLARNFDRSEKVEHGWYAWNAHSRVELLTLTNKLTGDSRQVYAHESGNGWASVPSLDVAELAAAAPLTSLTTMFAPKRVLVLFAGVGADMTSIDADCGGACDITGVEINRQMVEHALGYGDPRLRAFLGRPNIRLDVAEAREFLARDRSKYDAILLSWWGAGASHYMGTSGKLAQYLYTKEAFDSLMDHLNPGGIIVLYNGSKAQTLATLREVFRERGRGDLDGYVVIFRNRPERQIATATTGFYDTLENMRLVLKPSGFDDDDMAIVRATSERLESELILFPGGVMPGSEVYWDLATGSDLTSINAELIRTHDIELSVATDDRPFIDDLVPRSKYLDLSAWRDGRSNNIMWELTRVFAQFTLLLSAASVVLIIGPLLLRRGPEKTPANIVRLFYFGALGAGFMMVEIGLVRKLGLLLGHPSYSISIVLAALILSTGLGALASRRLFASGVLTEKRAAALIAAYVVAFTAAYPIVVSEIIALPIAVKAGVTLAILFPLGFLMGQLFPRGLELAGRDDPRLVSWAWAINGTSSTIGSAVAFLLSFALGFEVILYFGAAIYGVILVLPLGRSAVGLEVVEEPALS